jgi:hypothetical protein
MSEQLNRTPPSLIQEEDTFVVHFKYFTIVMKRRQFVIMVFWAIICLILFSNTKFSWQAQGLIDLATGIFCVVIAIKHKRGLPLDRYWVIQWLESRKPKVYLRKNGRRLHLTRLLAERDELKRRQIDALFQPQV